jgi:hypothetical protein
MMFCHCSAVVKEKATKIVSNHVLPQFQELAMDNSRDSNTRKHCIQESYVVL